MNQLSVQNSFFVCVIILYIYFENVHLFYAKLGLAIGPTLYKLCVLPQNFTLNACPGTTIYDRYDEESLFHRPTPQSNKKMRKQEFVIVKEIQFQASSAVGRNFIIDLDYSFSQFLYDLLILVSDPLRTSEHVGVLRHFQFQTSNPLLALLQQLMKLLLSVVRSQLFLLDHTTLLLLQNTFPTEDLISETSTIRHSERTTFIIHAYWNVKIVTIWIWNNEPSENHLN